MNFTQSVKSEDQMLIYEGILYLKDDLSLWHYKKPVEKKIYTDKNNIQIYEPELMQVIVMKNNIKMNLPAMYHKAKSVKQGLKVFYLENQAFYIAYNDKSFQSLSFQDHNDNAVHIDFSATIFNPKLNKALFDFKPSPDLDIIYQD